MNILVAISFYNLVNIHYCLHIFCDKTGSDRPQHMNNHNETLICQTGIDAFMRDEVKTKMW